MALQLIPRLIAQSFWRRLNDAQTAPLHGYSDVQRAKLDEQFMCGHRYLPSELRVTSAWLASGRRSCTPTRALSIVAMSFKVLVAKMSRSSSTTPRVARMRLPSCMANNE